MTTKTTPLDNLPLNTNSAFAMATLPGGCELYFPVDSMEDSVIREKQKEMQAYLNWNFPVDPILA
jgi:hypothetical protein